MKKKLKIPSVQHLATVKQFYCIVFYGVPGLYLAAMLSKCNPTMHAVHFKLKDITHAIPSVFILT